MRSVRLSEDLEHRVEEAAKASGVPVSELIRQAVRQHCREVLADTLDLRLADLVGTVESIGRRNVSRRTGREFARLLKRDKNQR